MKKLLLFLSICSVAVSFNSCNNDNDDTTLDKVVGKWRLSQILYKVDQQYVNFDEISECEKKMTLEVFENGTYIEKDYSFNDIQNSCDALTPINGTWKNLGNSMYEMSDVLISGITIALEMKVIFEGHNMIAEFSGTIEEDGEEYDIAMKFIFIDNNFFVPDSIIGKWQLDQEFEDSIEVELTECEKTMTLELFEDGIYEEKDFYDEGLECVAHEIKNGTWKNLGNEMYEITGIDIPEVKVTFNSNKMTVEFSETVDEVTHTGKLIFIKVSS